MSLLPFLFIWLVADFIIRFRAWKIRKNVMKKFAQELKLEFLEKTGHKVHYILNGNYLGKNISIEEHSILPRFRLSGSGIGQGSGGHVLFGTTEIEKILKISVDNKLIYERNGDRLLPFPSKIKKILDNYINFGIIPKKVSPILITALFFIFCILFSILLIIFVLPKLII